MQHLLDRYFQPTRENEGGGGGAAAEAAAGAAGAAGGAAAGTGTAGGGGGPVAAGAAAGASGDPAAAAAAAAAAAQPYRPEGLPDTMFGKDDRETIDKLHKSVTGYRERDSAKGVPDKPEAYLAFDPKTVPDTIKSHLEGLTKDPLFAEVSKIAMERKIPVADMQALTTALYAKAAEAGILEPAIDAAAERLALLPDSAKALPKAQQDAAIDARLKANEDFVKHMVGQGLDKDAAEHGLLMLMDTAKGNQLIEFFAGKLTGGDKSNPMTGAGSSAAQDRRGQLRADLAKPEMNPQHPKFNRAAHDALDAEYRKLIGD